MMQRIADQEFHYLGLGTFSSVCRLRAFDVEGAPTVLIATEVPHNPGTSVTNAAQDIAAQAYQWLERPKHGITLIEHYEQDGEERYAQERFALVTFEHSEGGRFSGLEWRYVTKEDVERMVGQALSDSACARGAEPLRHEQLALDAQFAEVTEKLEYLRTHAPAAFLNDKTQAAMETWLHTAHEQSTQTEDAAQVENAARCLANARSLYFDLYPARRAVEEQLLEDHLQVQGRAIRVSTLNVWRAGATVFEEVGVEPGVTATIERTDALNFSWDSSDGESEAYCVPLWRVILSQLVPEAENAAFVGVAGIHRSVDGRMFDPARSEEPEYTWIE